MWQKFIVLLCALLRQFPILVQALVDVPSIHISENHNIEVDLDLAGDLAQLKKNLAKLRKGRHGKGLGDILIEEIDWVGFGSRVLSNIISLTRYRTTGR